MMADVYLDLREDFESFGITIPNNDIIEKCEYYGLEGTQIVEKYVAYRSNNNISDAVTKSDIDIFEKESLGKAGAKKIIPRMKNFKPNRNSFLSSQVDNLIAKATPDDQLSVLELYGASPVDNRKPLSANLSNLKRVSMDPTAPAKKYVANSGHSFPADSSEESSQNMTPSQLANPANRKFSTRSNAGQVLTDYNTLEDNSISSSRPRLNEPLLIDVLRQSDSSQEQSSDIDFLYMFDRWTDRAHILDNYVCEHIERILVLHNLEHSCLTRANFPLQEEGYIAGFIAVESSGRLTANSCLLVGASVSGLGSIMLDLSDPNLIFSLFPGMPVVLKGSNPTGKLFFVKDVLCLDVPSKINVVKRLDEKDKKDLNVLLACGPYTTSDSMEAEPLSALLMQASKELPDVLILLGPFIDEQNPQIKNYNLHSYEDLFNERLDDIARFCSSKEISLVVVSSQLDAHHHPVYPTPQFDALSIKNRYSKVKFVSDPCFLKIGSYSFGITSTDILMHLGGEEISAKCSSDRMTRLCEQILRQRNFYPLQPPYQEFPLDYNLWDKLTSLPELPDILVLPSNLRQFIKNVSGVLCINPGKLTRGEAGGTFCKLVLSNSSNKNSFENDPDENVIQNHRNEDSLLTVPCQVKIVRI